MRISEGFRLFDLKFINLLFVHFERRFPSRHNFLQDLLVGNTISCEFFEVIVTFFDTAPKFVTSTMEKFGFALEFGDADPVNNVPFIFGQTMSVIAPEFARDVFRS